QISDPCCRCRSVIALAIVVWHRRPRRCSAFPIAAMSRALGDSGNLNRPPPPFLEFCCKQRHLHHFTQGWPLRGAWVALGWPKGGPWVTQSQTQSQSQSAEGRDFLMSRGAKIAAQQTVIVSDRRSREPNDLNQAKPTADC